jgi:hypothetical protein
MLWLIAVSGQALARNTHLVTSANAFTASGPCTEMVIWELVAHSVTATVSGLHLNPCAVAKNRQPLYCTGSEILDISPFEVYKVHIVFFVLSKKK